MKAVKCRVYGRVQRVGFRRYVLEVARGLKLKGYVKNEPDDSVTVFAQGDDEAVENLINLIKNAPLPSKVESIDATEAKPEQKIRYFTVKYGRIGDELQEGFGAMQTIFLDYWSEFRDFRGEFRDFRSEFQEFRGEFRDFRGEFQEFRGEFRDFRSEFKDFRGEFQEFRGEFRDFAKRTDENFKAVMEKFGEVSDKLTTILNTLLEESRKTSEMLDAIRRDSRETREMLVKALRLLEKAIEARG